MAAAQARVHPHYLRSEDLGQEITQLCGYIFAATYRLLVMIREFDQDKLWADEGICSCAHWLNYQCGIGLNAAREKVRVAHALESLPNISAAFEKGKLKFFQGPCHDPHSHASYRRDSTDVGKALNGTSPGDASLPLPQSDTLSRNANG
jgi:hypothetical protein